MLALRERLGGPSKGHSAEGLLDGPGARRVPPNARASSRLVPRWVPPTAGSRSISAGAFASIYRLGHGAEPEAHT